MAQDEPEMHTSVLAAGLKGRCPRCGVEQEFPASGRLRGERALDCPRCHNHLTFSAAVVP